MNDKIKLLAEQAKITFTDYGSGEFLDENDIDTDRLEKFAGLIQYEIIKLIEGCHYRNGIDSEHNKALNMAVDQIKQYFGVEE